MYLFLTYPVYINLYTTGNPFLGTKLLGFSIGRGSGALKGLTSLTFLSFLPPLTKLVYRVARRLFRPLLATARAP